MSDKDGKDVPGVDQPDDEVSLAMVRVQVALAGIDMQVALNAIANTLGVFAVLGAETKGDALTVVRTAKDSARAVVEDIWGRPDINERRAAMRGYTTQ